MGAHLRPLAVLEIAIGGRDAALARLAAIAIAARAHRASGFAPEKSGVTEDAVEASSLGLAFDAARTRYHHCNHARRDVAGLRALLGELPLSAGRRWLGPGVEVGEMDQARGLFAGAEVVLRTFQDRTGMARSESQSLLAKFGLGADHVDRSGRDLSPGERSRALLAALMAEGVNCLVLDEPTNHLDIEAIEQLEQALGSFEGTLILVSHDRRFLESVDITRTIELS